MKKLLYLGIVLMLASCNNNNHCGNGVQDGDETGVDCGGSCVTLCPTPTPTADNVGQSYGGGIIAYLLQSGDLGYDPNTPHGLIAAEFDQGGAGWGCYGTTIGNTFGGYGEGISNTDAILAGCTQNIIAARVCSELELNGYDDWHLPSFAELRILYDNRDLIGGFDNTKFYWSSTEKNNWYAHNKRWSNGDENVNSTKSNGHNIRAVRYF